MIKKNRLRKKFFSIRKKKYFDVNKFFFYFLIKLFKKKRKKNINLAIYYPTSFEVNVLKLFGNKIENRIKTYLPVINSKNSMHFYRWDHKDVLQINKFGILEPVKTTNHMVPDVMLVPLLAYDDEKNRLGYGKGFYDKYLRTYLNNNNNIVTIGIAFSFQKYHKLPVSNKDVKLNYILTEKGLF